MEARIGSLPKAGQIAGNFNTLIMLRVKELATAELLTTQLPTVQVVSTVASSSVSDTNDPGEFTDFASRNENRIAPETVPMLAPTDLVQLPKGQAFALLHGGQLHKIRMPLPGAGDDPLMPAGLLLVAWTLDWMFVAHVWPGRAEGLRTLLAEELAAGTAMAAHQGRSAAAMTAPANALYALLFEATGLHEMGQWFAEGSSLSIPDTVVRSTWIARKEAIEVAMIGTQLLGLRVGILVRFLPLLALLYALGAAEGLSQRAIRRAQAARESASLYHRAKYGQIVVLTLGGSMLLIWPAPVAWGLCAGVGAVLVGVLAAGQWAYYKKHV